jgi:hypothetical protein
MTIAAITRHATVGNFVLPLRAYLAGLYLSDARQSALFWPYHCRFRYERIFTVSCAECTPTSKPKILINVLIG